MRRRYVRESLRSLPEIAVSIVLMAAPAFAAAEATLSLEGAAGYTNNLLRQPDGPDDAPVSLGLAGTWMRNSAHLSADVEGRVDGVAYLNDSFDDEVLGQFDGSLTWWPVSERLGWVVDLTYGQISTDPFEPISPDNQQNTTFLSTGPDWYFDIGDRMRGYLGARYEGSQYEVADSDNQRLMALAGLERPVSSTSHLALRLSSESVDYDSLAHPDFNRHEAYVTYHFARELPSDAQDMEPTSARRSSADRGIRQSGLTVNAGYTWLSGDIDPASLPFLEMTFAKAVSDSVTVGVELASRFYDAGAEFASGELRGGGSAIDPGVIPDAGVYEERSGGAHVDFQRSRTSFTAAVSVADEIYETVALECRRLDARFTIEREMTRRLTGSAQVQWARYEYDFDGLDREDDDIEYRLELRRQLSRRLALRVFGLYSSRSSDDAAVEYDEARGFLAVEYALL